MMSGATRFCRENGLDPIGLGIEVEIVNNPEDRMMTKLIFTFNFPDGFTQEQRKAILANTDNCYVRKHLITPPLVEVRE